MYNFDNRYCYIFATIILSIRYKLYVYIDIKTIIIVMTTVCCRSDYVSDCYC